MRIWIRSSLLDEDCDRRMAAKQWRKLFIQHGYAFRETQNHVGASQGRAAHRVFEAMLKFKRDVGNMPDMEYGVENSLRAMDEEIRELGLNPDPTTPNRETAAVQLRLMAREFNQGYLPFYQPKIIEENLSIYMNREKRVMLTTTPDHFSAEGILHDFKTGARKPKAAKQMGLQSIILKEHGETAKEAALIWIPRTGMKDHEIISYSIKECEEEAEHRVIQVVRMFDEYIKERTPLVFNSNEKSTSCDPRYCPVYGNPFCALKQGEKVE